MIASIRYTKAKIAKALADAGCTKVPKATFSAEGVQPHDMWQTEWGHKFMAPSEGCAIWDMQRIIEREVEGTRPKAKKS